MKRIAVVAVRIAVELEEGQDLDHAESLVQERLTVLDCTAGMNWQFDEWGLDYTEPESHIFEVEDDWDLVPQIRGRVVKLV